MSTGQFYPRYSFIDDITLGQTTTFTFASDCDFTDGEIVSFRVSRPSGTVELNNLQARVITHTDTSITVDIDSSNFTPYVSVAVNLLVFPAMVVPAGSGIIPRQATATINLEDSFDHKPPT